MDIKDLRSLNLHDGTVTRIDRQGDGVSLAIECGDGARGTLSFSGVHGWEDVAIPAGELDAEILRAEWSGAALFALQLFDAASKERTMLVLKFAADRASWDAEGAAS